MTIIRSRYPDVDIPTEPITDFVLAGRPDEPDGVALIDGITDEAITNAELARYIDRLSAALAARGLVKGDVIAVFSPNSIWYPVVFHGIAAAGCVITPINSLYTVDEIALQLNNAGAKLMITVPPFVDRAVAATEGTGVTEVIVIGGSNSGDDAGGHPTLAELLASEAPSVAIDFDTAVDLIALPYSSGTSGLPKGVMLTHRNLAADIAQCAPTADIVAGDDRVIAVLPFFHIYGLTVLMNQSLQWGGSVHTLPHFDLEQFLRVIQDHRITRAFVAPPIVLALAKHPLVDQYDLSSLRSIVSGAAPLDADLAQAAQDRLRARGGSVDVVQGYGMTELSPVSHTTPDISRQPPGASATPKGSVGYALANTECRLVDPATGADAAEGERGELWIRGPQVMTGYLNNPTETAETLDSDGWLHTGDVALVDDEGRFTVVDRVKELIKYKGYQVAPAELEAVLLGNPGIADAAVIGVPDEAGGEAPKAFIVRAPGTDLSEDDVMAYLTARVAPHKKVRHVQFIDQIPKSAAGKILRRQLRD